MSAPRPVRLQLIRKRGFAGSVLDWCWIATVVVCTVLLTFGWAPRVIEAGVVSERDMAGLFWYLIGIALGCFYIGARAAEPRR